MQNITVQELHERIKKGEDLHIIDVRELDEYEEDNIGATLVPLSDLRNFDADTIDNLMNEEVIVHCRSGKRSLEACSILEQMGYVDTVNVVGGILEWRATYEEENIQ